MPSGTGKGTQTQEVVLDVRNLTTSFHLRDEVVRAVDGVSFSVRKGETVGIVGESGSGKSVSCYSLLKLLPMPPARIEAGQALFGGRDLLRLTDGELRHVRGRQIAMIFQDPMTSLNPYLRISTQLIEPLLVHGGASKKEALERAIEELRSVNIAAPEKRIHGYPHEFSGGMRQRVMIAMALITRPAVLIADEPTTALDVTVQRQVLELIKSRQKELGTAVVFITHDLAVVSEVCDRVNVMYAGRIVESAPAGELFSRPMHAYTRALQRSIPASQEKGKELFTIPGMPPHLGKSIQGCAFHPRSGTVTRDLCLRDQPPPLVEKAPGHWVQDCPGCLGPWEKLKSES